MWPFLLGSLVNNRVRHRNEKKKEKKKKKRKKRALCNKISISTSVFMME